MSEPADNPPARAQSSPPTSARLVSRRGVLLSGTGIVIAAGCGTAAAALRPRGGSLPAPQPPMVLVDALAAERALLASVAASLTAYPQLRTVLAQLIADHRWHEQVLVATLAHYPGASAAPSTPASTPPPSSAPGAAQLAAAERQASAAAAGRAGKLRGADAALLASIAACEATHAVLLT